MKTDLFGVDPAERIAALERKNAELRSALAKASAALQGLRPALTAMHEAMEAAGQARWESDQLLDRKKESSHESN